MFTLLILTGMVAGAIIWLTAIPVHGRSARSAAWAYLVIPLVSGVYLVAGGDARAGYGVSRFLTVAVMTYALMRAQLLGLDVKVRWTFSKSTIAAVFIAAFFVASETAQQFFGDVAGSQYIGIVVAGALVFAIAPLHRIADRLAEKAIPLTPGPMDGRSERAPQRAYRLALLAALRDDAKIGPDEELHLADLAETLGLGAGEAMRIRREIVNARVRAP